MSASCADEIDAEGPDVRSGRVPGFGAAAHVSGPVVQSDTRSPLRYEHAVLAVTDQFHRP